MTIIYIVLELRFPVRLLYSHDSVSLFMFYLYLSLSLSPLFAKRFDQRKHGGGIKCITYNLSILANASLQQPYHAASTLTISRPYTLFPSHALHLLRSVLLPFDGAHAGLFPFTQNYK